MTNNPAVVPTVDFADEAIAEGIFASMERIRWVEPEDANLTVEKREEILTGCVATWSAMRPTHAAAIYTPRCDHGKRTPAASSLTK